MPAIRKDATRAAEIGEMLRSADGRRALADHMEQILFRDALDAQWPAGRDSEHGGYLTDLDRRWRPAGVQNKSLEFVARQTAAYARAASVYPSRGYDEAARHGFAFLTDKMWDAEHGGFFTLVDRSGKPLEKGRKHPHAHLYTIDAFVDLAPVMGIDTVRPWAIRTFDWLESVAWDAEHGGYWGYYERDNRMIVPDGKPRWERYDWIATPLGFKDLNVVNDALSTMVDFAATGWDSRATARAVWHNDHFLDTLLPCFDSLPYLYKRDWSIAPDILRAGQPLQMITALFHSGRQCGRLDEAITASKSIVSASDYYFSHPDGGYKFGSSIHAWAQLDTDLTIPKRLWWIQTEAARGYLLLAMMLPDEPQFGEAFARQWTFIERAMIDPHYHGFFESAEQGIEARRWHFGCRREQRNKLNIWKDVSHETLLLMDAPRWLRNGPG